MLNFTILSENRSNGIFEGESGLSIYIEYNNQRFLLDTGYSSLFLENAKKLNINLDAIQTVVLTHGHSDHTNGVPYLNPGKKIIMHPQGFKERYSMRKKEYVGFPMTEDALRKLHSVTLTSTPLEFLDNVYFLGEIPMEVDFESSGNFSTTLDPEFTQKDFTEDDSGIAIKTDNGLIVFTGCGHRGVCNTIEHAKHVTGESRIHAVLGGFHLRNLEKQQGTIDKTIEYFKSNDIKHLYLGHCITDDVINYFREHVGEIEVHSLSAGKEFTIGITPNQNLDQEQDR